MDEQLHLLTGAYALNALDGDEREAFERRALASPDAREEVRGLSETAALLAYATPPVSPPPELKAKVMASIRNTRQLPPESVVSDLGTARRRRAARSSGTTAARWLGAAAAVFLVAAAGLGAWAINLAGEQQRTEQRLEALARQQAEVMAVFSAPDSRVIPAHMDGATVTIAHSAQADKAAVITHNLPRLGEDRDYELWLISDAGARPAGLIQPGDSAEVSMNVLGEVSGAVYLGITVEPAGGSPQPTSDPIMLQAL